jgi:enoyl-CoA hydratase/carnithine racemase
MRPENLSKGSAMSKRVVVDIVDHVASVRMSRPEKQNALDSAMFEGLSEAGRSLQHEAGVRAVILHAEGEHFCAGIDVSMFSSGAVSPEKLDRLEDSIANYFQHPAYVWKELRVPVICVVKGNTFGGGLQIALGADIRIASPNARLSIMEVNWGLIPDLAISSSLKQVMPLDRIKELTFTGRIVDGEEALALGLVTQLSTDPLAAARAMAKQIAASSPDAIQSAKRLIDEGFKLSDEESLRMEAELQLGVLAGPNQAEAVKARLAKRSPEFKDRLSSK